MKLETERNNVALSKGYLEGNEMKCPSLSVPHFQQLWTTYRMSTFSILNK